MNHPPANPPALPPVQAERWLDGPPPPDEGWTRNKFLIVLAFVLTFHVALIVLFETKRQILPRVVSHVPHLELADPADELISLGDPTLLARANAHDLVSAFWRRMPAIKQPDFNWTESPRYLAPAPENFGAAFREYVQNSRPVFPMNFKPEPGLTAPEAPLENVMPQATTMQISGELRQRPLLHMVELPSPQYNDVLAPTTVQALVDMAGNVASAIVLKPSGGKDADQLALQLTRNLRFAPAPRLMFGELSFAWHSVPANSDATNAP